MQKKKNYFLLTCFIIVFLILSCKPQVETNYIALIEQGKFAKATEIIKEKLIMDTTLTAEQQRNLEFEIDRMERIRLDFKRTETEIFEFIKKYIPEVTKSDLQKWENEKSLEMKLIDGEKRYFNYAARNLFRINKECRKIWEDYHKEKGIDLSVEKMDIDINNRAIMKNSLEKGIRYSEPVTMRVKFSISVNPDVVPEGETIRCWLPFPREIENRQFNIKLLNSEPNSYQLADNSALQRTVYFEKTAIKGQETNFFVQYQYTSQGEYTDINPEKVTDVDYDGELKEFLKEEKPHIVFTAKMKKLSDEIVGDETNPYYKAKKIFRWIYDNIPWASAREYSTIRNISDYCITNMHGDCGIKGLTFITLLRLNGIPARWQSGWEFKPPYNNMHDWTFVYFEPYGWVPADPDYSIRNSQDEKFKYYYLSGADSYRLIFNDDYSKPFIPPKIHHRSFTVDLQRGEVEWKGGNLYKDKWDWDLDFEVIDN